MVLICLNTLKVHLLYFFQQYIYFGVFSYRTAVGLIYYKYKYILPASGFLHKIANICEEANNCSNIFIYTLFSKYNTFFVIYAHYIAGETDLIMSNNVKIAVIGGDLRQLEAAKMFAESGIETAVYGFDRYSGDFSLVTKCRTPADTVHGANVVLLPLPCSLDKESVNAPLHEGKIMLKDLLNCMAEEQILCAGMYSINRRNTYDYYTREELKILNAIPTAEGAIALALNEMPNTLHGAKSVILGYGRIGKALAERLKGLGSSVTVVARKESDLAKCESSSYNAVHLTQLKEAVAEADVIFNTVPAILLDDNMLGYVNKRTLIIDLAGKPGGVDFDAAKQLGIKAIWALSLPGKTAPVTAGKIIYKTICNILKQEGVLWE